MKSDADVIMSLNAGTFQIFLGPDGRVIVPDLAEPLIPALSRLGADATLWANAPAVPATPVLTATRGQRVWLPHPLIECSSEILWAAHDAPPSAEADGVSLLDVKLCLARRMLAGCQLCERRCDVRRDREEPGFCGLGADLQVGAHAMLWNEGPLVGAPTFSVFLRGCALRCRTCYRPDELIARDRPSTSSKTLAQLLDQAAERGAQTWHFLGGNPEESLPGVLAALRATRNTLPVAWNSALIGTPEVMRLLKGVVDVWIPDLKFGNDVCAHRESGFVPYLEPVLRNLRVLAMEPYVVVRHLRIPGHETCCRDQVRAVFHKLPSHFLYREQDVTLSSRIGPRRRYVSAHQDRNPFS